MKVLWITNILFPDAYTKITGNDSSNVYGGWLVGALTHLKQESEIELIVASVSAFVKSMQKFSVNGVLYYVIPLGKGNVSVNREYDKYWLQINKEIFPDVVHIHGTEFSHGLSYMKTCGASNVVISIQGLTSVYSRYYNSGLSDKDIIRNITLRDILKRDTLYQGQNKYVSRGRYEVEMLKISRFVMGRTCWDYVHTKSINPQVTYFKCNETLRPEFLVGDRWDYNSCERFSIFVTQSYYPIKGFHILIKALNILKKFYPEFKVYVAGGYSYKHKSIFSSIKESGYSRYVRRLVRDYKLIDHICYLGPLDALSMKEQYLKSNVFVLPSAIENSPNSLCEAQILGVPSISSYVGGVSTLIPSDSCGLVYPFDEYEMLAFAIKKIFDESATYDNSTMIEVARERHDGIANAKETINIYNYILNKQ